MTQRRNLCSNSATKPRQVPAHPLCRSTQLRVAGRHEGAAGIPIRTRSLRARETCTDDRRDRPGPSAIRFTLGFHILLPAFNIGLASYLATLGGCRSRPAARSISTSTITGWVPAPYVFWSFRVMVGFGLLMTAIGGWSLVQCFRRRLDDEAWLLRAVVAMPPAGFIAVLAGWTTTEVGRQRFAVCGMLRTADSTSPIAMPAAATSLARVRGHIRGGLFHRLRRAAVPPAGVTPAQALRPGPDPAVRA